MKPKVRSHPRYSPNLQGTACELCTPLSSTLLPIGSSPKVQALGGFRFRVLAFVWKDFGYEFSGATTLLKLLGMPSPQP